MNEVLCLTVDVLPFFRRIYLFVITDLYIGIPIKQCPISYSVDFDSDYLMYWMVFEQRNSIKHKSGFLGAFALTLLSPPVGRCQCKRFSVKYDVAES